MTKYAILPRYPNELGITNDDMKTAIQFAKDVQEFVLKVIKPGTSETGKNGKI